MNKKALNSIFLMILTGLLLTSCISPDINKLNQRALELLNQGQIDTAISRLESISDLDPNLPETNYNLGVAYLKKGAYDKSIASLNKAVKVKTNFADAHYSLAVALEDKANSLIDLQKNAKKQDLSKINADIKQNLVFSKINYEKYLELSKNASDKDEVVMKISFLDKEILKYQ